jgi:hypothetical protein
MYSTAEAVECRGPHKGQEAVYAACLGHHRPPRRRCTRQPNGDVLLQAAGLHECVCRIKLCSHATLIRIFYLGPKFNLAVDYLASKKFAQLKLQA